MNLNTYCKRNVLSDAWLNEYTKTKEFMSRIIHKGKFNEQNYAEFENITSKLPCLFDEIQFNAGLNDAFKEFAEEQTWNIGGLYNLLLKHPIAGKDEAIVSLFEDTLKILEDNEKELDSL